MTDAIIPTRPLPPSPSTGRVNVDELLRDLNTFASSGKLPNGLPETTAVASGGGMRVKGMTS